MREPIASQYFTVDVTDGAFLFERQEKRKKKKAHFSYTPLLCRTYAYVDEHQRERKEEMGRETENVNRSSLSQCWRPISDHTESIHKLRKRRTRTTKRVTPTCTHVSVFRPCECVKLGLLPPSLYLMMHARAPLTQAVRLQWLSVDQIVYTSLLRVSIYVWIDFIFF